MNAAYYSDKNAASSSGSGICKTNIYTLVPNDMPIGTNFMDI